MKPFGLDDQIGHFKVGPEVCTHVDRVPPRFAVMRADDNGNEVEVKRVTSRCEAEALQRELEARGHKQLYWVVSL